MMDDQPPPPAPEPALAPGSLRFLVDGAWWKEAFGCAKRFAPRCIVPAILLTLANIGLVWSLETFSDKTVWLQKAQSFDNITQEQIAKLMFDLIVLMFTILASMGLLFSGLNMWLIRMHTFAHACGMRGLAASDADFEEARANTKFQYVLLFWLVGSLFVLPPFFLILAFTGVSISFRMPSLWEGGHPPAVVYGMPSSAVMLFCDVAALAWFLPIVAYTLVGMAIGGIGGASAPKLAVRSFTQSVKHFAPVSVVTIVVCLINTIINSPVIIAPLIQPALERNLAFIVLSQVWMGVFSVVLWPFSVAAFFMLTNYARKFDVQQS